MRRRPYKREAHEFPTGCQRLAVILMPQLPKDKRKIDKIEADALWW